MSRSLSVLLSINLVQKSCLEIFPDPCLASSVEAMWLNWWHIIEVLLKLLKYLLNIVMFWTWTITIHYLLAKLWIYLWCDLCEHQSNSDLKVLLLIDMALKYLIYMIYGPWKTWSWRNFYCSLKWTFMLLVWPKNSIVLWSGPFCCPSDQKLK